MAGKLDPDTYRLRLEKRLEDEAWRVANSTVAKDAKVDIDREEGVGSARFTQVG